MDEEVQKAAFEAGEIPDENLTGVKADEDEGGVVLVVLVLA